MAWIAGGFSVLGQNFPVLKLEDAMTKMTTLVILFAAVVSPVGSSGPQQTWATKDYHAMMDGNELYGLCQKVEKTTTVLGGEMDISLDSPKDVYATGKCLGYINAAVDSIPVGEGFDAPMNVKL